ncbi:class I SAM-dependent methyltransferase [Kordiimonas aquimaris]|uniref:class I SAM-dependent methyltransferase n=1 Tax=Kordiimonas aquimaris TaxID=707591 RepID=UPI0021D1CFD0|nr:hypothetical protein [Kordiimonas aquimaris]
MINLGQAFIRTTVAAVTLGMIGVAVNAEHHGEKDNELLLESILRDQPTSSIKRYGFRHPKETLQFFGIEPGMIVADTLPGSYYSNILLPYLGDEGKLIGVQYSEKHRAIDFGDNAERMERHKGFPARFTAEAEGWRGEGKTDIDAFLFGDMPENLKGTVDVFLLFRAMHHLNKHEEAGGTRTEAFADIYDALKPGGVVGIVQHRAPAGNSDEWARGFNGYIKQEPLIANMKAAGFEFVGSSEINANPRDIPTEEDFVWRLLPVLNGTKDNPELRAEREAIGESDRMTLKFRKPE